MSVEKLLSQLRGIQPPLEPGWWPLAPGWWALLGLTALLIFAYVYFRQHRSKLRLYQQANLDLQRISNLYAKPEDNQLLLLSLSSWLRQVCIIAYPDKPIAAITGREWIDLLDETMPENNFTQGIGKVFAGEVYSRQPVVGSDAILSLCNAWLLSMQPHLITTRQAKHRSVSS